MKSRHWIRLEFHLTEAYQDLLVGQLALLGCEGFLQEAETLQAFVPAPAWTPKFKADLEQTLTAFHDSFPDFQPDYTFTKVTEENWNKRWERSSGIVEATNRILIKPSWKKLRKRDRGKIVLHIDPKMSFGTGHHETTRLCLSLLERAVAKGTSVLDFGCGTGVLAIAAVKLGARSADAVDNDEWAIVNTRENIRRNRSGVKVRARLGDASSLPRKRYDLIVSNTDVPTLRASLPSLVSVLRPGGMLLLSGLLATDLEDVLALAAQSSMELLEVLSENEWAALSLRAPDASRHN